MSETNTVAYQHQRVDPEALPELKTLLDHLPGGFNAIRDINERRQTVYGMAEAMFAEIPDNPNVTKEDRVIPGPEGAPDVTIRIYRHKDAGDNPPGIYYIHGGGLIFGNIALEDPNAVLVCDQTKAVVISVDYRLAPENPYPAGLEDCYAGLLWMASHAQDLGFDPDRLAVYGGSAGGNLTIATCLLARDRKGPPICFMLPFYPMIDDRNETPSSQECTNIGVWDRAHNIEAWGWYLGGQEADGYAAPSRMEDLSGLPPCFIDVGELDVFRDESYDFAMRLSQAGVSSEFHVIPGAFHAMEVFSPSCSWAPRVWGLRFAALNRALHGSTE